MNYTAIMEFCGDTMREPFVRWVEADSPFEARLAAIQGEYDEFEGDDEVYVVLVIPGHHTAD